MRGIRPSSTEHAEYYKDYVAMVPDGEITEILERQIHETISLMDTTSERQGEYRYASDKWTVKEVFGHMADTERVMSYRLLAFGRGDTAQLPGFEEDRYVKDASFNQQTMEELKKNLLAVRYSTVHLLRSFHENAWSRSGTANGSIVSVNALAYIIAGHELHHRSILIERYVGAETYPKE